MRIEVIAQPDATSSNLLESLRTTLEDARIDQFWAVTAWTNHRGLARLLPELRGFRGRTSPGVATIVVGIDEGGATEQGLQLAANEFDHAYVFSTSDERTFHPKFYMGTGPSLARLFLGSNNLTPGGLFYNFE